MSYIANSSTGNIDYSNPMNNAQKNKYIERVNKPGQPLITGDYPSKKTSTTRIKYDLRKLNNN